MATHLIGTCEPIIFVVKQVPARVDIRSSNFVRDFFLHWSTVASVTTWDSDTNVVQLKEPTKNCYDTKKTELPLE